jgi:hypothetical protein
MCNYHKLRGEECRGVEMCNYHKLLDYTEVRRDSVEEYNVQLHKLR